MHIRFVEIINQMGLPKITEQLSEKDYIMIVQDNCMRIISYKQFIEDSFLGGFSICESVMNCWSSMGDFDSDVDVPEDTPPQFKNLVFNLDNREQNFILPSDAFLQNYYDAEGDKFGKIIIKGGDFSGVTYNGYPIFQGLVIPVDQLDKLEYDAKNQDGAYRQEIEIEVYDENNVKAE